jgi:hypothetical protein
MSPIDAAEAAPDTPGWSQAPEDATHVYQPPGWPWCWLKLGAPDVQELWRRPSAKNWRPGVDLSGKWLEHPHVMPRPSAS